MKTIKNIDQNDIVIPFEGFTYSLKRNIPVLVEENVFDFLVERYPLSFATTQKVDTKNPPINVDKVKTKSFLPNAQEAMEKGNQDMRIHSPKINPTFGEVENLPESGTIDKDGVEWYGDGIQITGGQQ